MPRGAAGLLWLAFMLAGCLSPTAPADAEEDQRRAAGDLTQVELVAAFSAWGCRGSMMVFYAPHEAVKPELPGMYTPSPVLLTPLNNVHLFAVHCERLHVGLSDLENVSVAVTGTPVQSGQFYRWETFVDEDNGTLAATLRRAGWLVHDATLLVSDGQVVIEAPGIRYVATSALPPEGSDADDDTKDRFDHLGDDGRLRHSEERFTAGWRLPLGLSTVHLEADGGVLASIMRNMGLRSGKALSPRWTPLGAPRSTSIAVPRRLEDPCTGCQRR